MIRWTVLSVVMFSLLVGALVPACNVFLPAVGGAGQPCKPDLTCDPGLACLQNRCLAMIDGGDGGDGGDDAPADGDSGSDKELDGGDDGECINENDCDDDNPCTDDTCVDHVCAHAPNTGDCDDHNPCTNGDKCVSGLCAGKLEDRDNDGHVRIECNGDDCNDDNPQVHPGVPEGPPSSETCMDHLDNNCDGAIDENDIGCRTCNADPDCEDTLYCTGPEKCENHLCIRGLSPCDDNLLCTIDICYEQQQICDHGLVSNTCRIDNQCFNNAERNPANDCQVCNATKPFEWSSIDGAPCDDSNACTEFDRCDKGTCVGSRIDHDHDGFESVPCGLDCNDENFSVHPGASEGPVGSSTCVDTLDNDCDGQTDQNDPDCKCVNDDQCSDFNRCNGQELCLDGRCVQASESPCVQSSPCLDCNTSGCPIFLGYCLIQNVCYSTGEHPPVGDTCPTCVPSRDQEHWSNTCH